MTTTQMLYRDLDADRSAEPVLHDPAHLSTTVILRTTGIVLLMGIAVIHIVQLVPTFQQTPMLGWAFLSLMAGSVIVGAWLIRGHRSPLHLWLPVAGLGAAAIMGYVFTRTFSSLLDRVDVGNWTCELGMAALFVEGSLVAIALYAMTLPTSFLRGTSMRDFDALGSDVTDSWSSFTSENGQYRP